MMELTKEEQIQAIYDLKVGYTLGHADIAMLKAMARQLLAGLEQEPVYQACKEAGVWVDVEPDEVFALRANGEQVRSLYAAPQLPQPAVPDYDALRLAFEATERKSEHGFNLHKYGIGYADEATQLRWEQWVACRAAMLQGGKL